MATKANVVVVLGSVGLLLAGTARPARACGGFFCDQPQVNAGPPIAQSGENVLFVMDTDPQTGQHRVEAHIQIVYSGSADQFSWIVPVTAAPQYDVGTDVLFQRIEPATRPSFNVNYQTEGTCKGSGGGTPIGCAAGSSSKAFESGGGGRGPIDNNGGVDVVFHGNVGPYEATTVRADEPQKLRDFLTTNNYFVSPDASRLIDEYVSAGFYFVALRLQQGKDTTAIQPIILRMQANEACLPLKLTAIASVPDLRIGVWVLADARAVPINYNEIDLNMAKIDWFGSGKNYDQVVSTAADEAQGNAFTVEYAQPSTAVAAQITVPSSLVALRSASSPSGYLSALFSSGFRPSGDVVNVLQRHIPEPAALVAQGVTPAQFYQGVVNFQYSVSTTGFDAEALTTDLDTTVFQPLAKARALFDSHPYLTRLATFISPEEMTKDPLFVTNRTLPDMSAQHQASAYVQCGDEDFDYCSAPVRLRLEDGRDVWYRVPPGGTCNTYDRTELDTLPSANVGWRRDAEGTGDVMLDNRPAIAAALNAHNGTVAASLPGGCSCSLRGRRRPIGTGVGLMVAAATVCVLRRRRRAP